MCCCQRKGVAQVCHFYHLPGPGFQCLEVPDETLFGISIFITNKNSCIFSQTRNKPLLSCTSREETEKESTKVLIQWKPEDGDWTLARALHLSLLYYNLAFSTG